jgi:transposase-like protein
MARGRRPQGADVVDRLDGSALAKARLRALLETFSGRQTIGQASQALGISARRLHKLRRRLLQEVLQRLEPRPAGRPPRPVAAQAKPTAELQAEIRRLQLELQAARIRAEIALAMPQVLNRRRAKKRPRPAGR